MNKSRIMNKRARSDSLAEVSAAAPGGWLNLGRPGQVSILGRDLRKLFFSRLTDQDRDMVKRAHGVRDVRPPDKYMIDRCIRSGHCELAKWVIATYPNLYAISDSLHSTICTENLHMLDWLEVYDGRRPGFMEQVVIAATLFEKHQVIKWVESRGYIPTRELVCFAIRYGNVALLDYILEQCDSIGWDNDMREFATRYARIDALKWLCFHRYLEPK